MPNLQIFLHKGGEIRKLLKNEGGLKTSEQIMADKKLAMELITTHNVYFIIRLTHQIRQSIFKKNFFDFRDEWLKRYYE